MKLRTIEKNKDKSVTLHLEIETKDFQDGEESIGSVVACNEITFPDVGKAIEYFDKVYKQNKNIVENNKERLEQIDGDILKINEFAKVIEKSNALSKRNSEKIENLIDAYHSTVSLQRNIESTQKQNETNKQILEELKKLQ